MLRLIAPALAAALLCGCAAESQPQAFAKGADTIEISGSRSIVLASLVVTRNDNSAYVPLPTALEVGDDEGDGAKAFALSDQDAVQENGQSVYLVRLALTPGQHLFTRLTGLASNSTDAGEFVVPLNLPLNVEPNSVIYAGRINATLRARKDNEFRAGPEEPVESQKAAGLVDSTWDVKVETLTKSDVALFRKAYPVLKPRKLLARSLGQWDRKAVQRALDGLDPEEETEEEAGKK